MQKIKQFNTYLLTNHPTLWLSKLPFLLLCSIVLSLLLFVWGFVYMDFHQLTHSSAFMTYNESFASLFQGLATLCVLILWATSFYKKNALRSLYPLKRGYFLKMSFFLFFGFFTLMLPSHSFQWGVKLKTNILVDEETVYNDLWTYRNALPFLPENEDNYDQIDWYKKVFKFKHPDKTVNVASFDGVNWSEEFSYLPEMNSEELAKHSVTIEGYQKVFFLTKVKQLNCNESETTFISFLTPNIDSNHFFSIRYFVENDYNEHYIYDNIEEAFVKKAMMRDRNYRAKMHENFYHIVQKRDKKRLTKAIDELLAVEKKYGLKSDVTTSELVDYLIRNDFNLPNYNQFGYCGDNEFGIKIHRVPDKLEIRKESNWSPAIYCDQGEKLWRLAENYNKINYATAFEPWFPLIIIALFLTVVAMMFEFVNGIGFLLAVPTGFVLLLLNVLIYGIVYTIAHRPGDYFNEDFYGAVMVLVNILVIQGITILGLLKQWRKRFMNVLMVLAYSSVGFIPSVLVIIIYLSTKHDLTSNNCDYSFQTVSPVDWLMHPYWAVGSFVLCWLSFYPLIKRHFANPES